MGRNTNQFEDARRTLWWRRLCRSACLGLVSFILSGCAALTNPVADGITVRKLPPELLHEPRGDARTIPLSLLRQPKPDAYRLGAGDVLGVWIEGLWADPNQPPPVHYADQTNLPPALGYPFLVKEDGTVALPFVKPVPVTNLTLEEAQKEFRRAYTEDKKILQQVQPGQIIVSLIRPRQYHVLVIRQDSGGVSIGPAGTLGGSKRGTGHVVNLPATQNDVLSALALTGGLPGIDAINEVVIERAAAKNLGPNPAEWEAAAPLVPSPDKVDSGRRITRIPLRVRPGVRVQIRPEDVILNEGDIVFIESRDREVFYTGGLLIPGEHQLPRDYDLDVVAAVALVNSSLVNGAFSGSNLSGQVVSGGLGGPSPSLLTVLRRTPGGGQVPIRVDLNLAMRDIRERILVQPGDVLILQETPGEAVARYVSDVLQLNFFGTLFHGPHELGTARVTLP